MNQPPSVTGARGEHELSSRVDSPLVESFGYRLIDFGDGYRLESLREYVIQRPCPAAEGIRKRYPSLWRSIDASYQRYGKGKGGWEFHHPWPDGLCWNVQSLRLDLRATPFGHLGVFPEQQENWSWLTNTAKALRANALHSDALHSDVHGLNLFAYTGGSTLAVASAGAKVVHVDAAKPSVESAKRNATLSGLQHASIRYITDDAREFVAREQRRGNKYHLLILDPPAYGHGNKGRNWRIDRDLWPLIENSLSLMTPEKGAILLTGHSEPGPENIVPWLLQITPWKLDVQYGRMSIQDRAGRSLDSGFFIRATWRS